jgi:copper chaperone CopZ
MNTKTAIISIGDLTGEAVPGLTKAFESVPGVTEVDFSVERKVAVIEFDPDTTSIDALMRVVLAEGYKVL